MKAGQTETGGWGKFGNGDPDSGNIDDSEHLVDSGTGEEGAAGGFDFGAVTDAEMLWVMETLHTGDNGVNGTHGSDAFVTVTAPSASVHQVQLPSPFLYSS